MATAFIGVGGGATKLRPLLSSRSRCRPLSVNAVSAADVFKKAKFPENWPFSPRDFERTDESTDTIFYDQPRFVYHIDDGAVGALTEYYAANLPKDAELLDICSSWVSHLPKDFKAKRVAGLGMNEKELKANKQLTDYEVKDLNVDPTLPYDDNLFDVVTNVVSVDYLAKPLEVFKEMNRVLKPGGSAIMSFSNRCFPTKAINIWLSTNDVEHVYIVGCYFHFAGGYNSPEAYDISPNPGRSDPMYIVQASKKA